MTIVTLMFVSFLLLLVPRDYVSAGRFTETVWHRVFVSLGVNPEWPFGNVQDMYDCKRYVPEGLVTGTADRNGHCVWWDYALKHGMPPESSGNMTYGRTYDLALREAFFDIARAYPAQTIKAFVYYKPLLLFKSIGENLEFRFAQALPGLLWLLAASLCNFLAFALIASPVVLSRDMKIVAGATAALAVFITIPYFIVWALPHTSGDLLLYFIFALGLAAFAAVKALYGLLFAPAPAEASRAPLPVNRATLVHDEPAVAIRTLLWAYGSAACLTLISQIVWRSSECGDACAVSFAKAVVWSLIWPLSWIVFFAGFF